MRIEAATVDSAHVIARLNETIHRLHCQLSPADFRTAPRDAVAAELAGMLSEVGTRAFAAWEDEISIGFCRLKIVTREPNCWIYGCRRLAVEQISVEPDFRRRRVGEYLMEVAFDFARRHGIDEVTLEYWSSNHAARDFY